MLFFMYFANNILKVTIQRLINQSWKLKPEKRYGRRYKSNLVRMPVDADGFNWKDVYQLLNSYYLRVETEVVT